ncbi:class A beta-lactamase [Muricoccus pecuniae]|uniref:beta-lactamase n=1 Tax=Muricoccus pecuniae TaxID=693023 RepID=A0A840YFG2_9PROT|nr:class A beta-lactamase [Roseomonas pecuniae]MBB5692614.1 beta-lactamase class A [Roseomonas pecuniae]
MAWRRSILLGAALAPLLPALPRAEAALDGEALSRALQRAEREGGGRLGVAVLDTATGARFARRGEERFPAASTFKFLLAAAILAAADAGRERLDRRLPIAASDLVEYAPVTGKHVGPEGLSVAELCEATMVWSDNPAANLLLPSLGGPEGLTRIVRGWGDPAFRLDRWETALGEGRPGDPRDTTTPLAMLGSMRHLLLGDTLSPASRARLTDWLVGCRTGDAKIRAGLPAGWRCGDKTGGGGHGTNNDIAVLWPPGRAPVLVAAYLTESAAPLEARNAALASVGRAVAAAVG